MKNFYLGILVFLPLSGFAQVSALSDSTKADSLYDHGVEKRKLMDYKGAIDDYTRAISIDPNYA